MTSSGIRLESALVGGSADVVAIESRTPLRRRSGTVVRERRKRKSAFVLLVWCAVAVTSVWWVARGRSGLVNSGGLDEVLRFFRAALHPRIDAEFLASTARAAAVTLSFAVVGTMFSAGLGVVLGSALATIWRRPTDLRSALTWVQRAYRGALRLLLIPARGTHEVIWALLLLNILGLDPLVAISALIIPFAAITARVFADQLDSVDPRPAAGLRALGAREWQVFFYGVFPMAFRDLTAYVFYRFECAIRSAAVLGLIGAGGLGYELQLSFQSLAYGEMWTSLYALIAISGLADAISSRVRSRGTRTRKADDRADGRRFNSGRVVGGRVVGGRVVGDRVVGGRVVGDRVVGDRVDGDRVDGGRVENGRMLPGQVENGRGFGGCEFGVGGARAQGTVAVTKASARMHQLSRTASVKRLGPVASLGALVVWAIATLNLHPTHIWAPRTTKLAREFARNWFPPDLAFAHVKKLSGLMIDTATLSIVSILLSFSFAVPIAFLASRRSSAHPIRRFLSAVARVVLLVARAIPPSVWAFLTVLVFYSGLLSGAIALAVYNFGVLGRLLGEVVENLDPNPAMALRSLGAGPAQVFAYGVAPVVGTRFTSYGLYRWEVAARETIVVGIVAAGGLGNQLKQRMAAFDYPQVTSAVLFFIGLTLLVDLASGSLKRRLA